MEPLLFLAHRLPFPPTKGDKVRSHHFLRHLAQHRDVYLGTFVDDVADLEHVAAARALCAEVYVERIDRRTRRLRSLSAFLSGEPMTLPYFRSQRLAAWVRECVARHRIRTAFAYSSPMAQYLADLPDLRRIVDFVDLDSAKWLDYARRRRGLTAAFYRRESRRLLAFEASVAAKADVALFVTREEAQLLKTETPGNNHQICAIENGVDCEYYSPTHAFPSPFADAELAVVFTGAMDYWPNIDAVVWFAHEVLPLVRRVDSRIRFHIVGMNPTSEVRALASDPSVSVSGRVPDVRPYLCHACAIVAPLRIARGIQNKVLEAMAMGRPVVATSASAAALGARAGVEIEMADDAAAFAKAVAAIINRDHGNAMGRRARAFVERDYQWSSRLARLDELLARCQSRGPDASHEAIPGTGLATGALGTR